MNEHAHESVNVHRWCSVGEWTVDESLYRLIGLISLENRLKSLRLSASGPHNHRRARMACHCVLVQRYDIVPPLRSSGDPAGIRRFKNENRPIAVRVFLIRLGVPLSGTP